MKLPISFCVYLKMLLGLKIPALRRDYMSKLVKIMTWKTTETAHLKDSGLIAEEPARDQTRHSKCG